TSPVHLEKFKFCSSIVFFASQYPTPVNMVRSLFQGNSRCIPSVVNDGLLGRIIGYIDDGCIDENFFLFTLVNFILTKFFFCVDHSSSGKRLCSRHHLAKRYNNSSPRSLQGTYPS